MLGSATGLACGQCHFHREFSAKYGSLTTFNILFKKKDDQFRTSA